MCMWVISYHTMLSVHQGGGRSRAPLLHGVYTFIVASENIIKGGGCKSKSWKIQV